MKRKLLIILAFLPLFLQGQYQTGNLDFLFNDSIAVNGSDTLLVDSITGTFDTDYILTFVDFDITLGYLPGKTAAKLNGQPIVTYFQNMNYADTLFTQWLDQELNADLTESSPFRIKRIAHYTTPTSDVNDYFESPPKGTVNIRDVGVGKTYTTFSSALTAAATGDTIYIYDGTYTESYVTTYYYMNKGVHVIGVGDVILQNVSGTQCIYFVVDDEIIFERVTISGANSTGAVINAAAGTENNTIKLCYITDFYDAGGSSDPFIISVGTEITNEKNVFVGDVSDYLFRFDGITKDINESYISGTFAEGLYSLSSDSSFNMSYCDVAIQTGDIASSFFRLGDYEFKYNNFNILSANTQILVGNQTGSGTNVNFYKNTIESEVACTNLIFLSSTIFDNIDIVGNSFTLTNISQTITPLQFSNIDADLTIGSNFIDTRGSTLLKHILITSGGAVTSGDININNNELHSRTIDTYVIRIGTETTGAGDYFIDGGNIIGNKILGAIHWNPLLTNVTNHGVFIGFNKNWTIKNNYVEGCGINYIQKSSSGINTSGGFFYNISVNPYLYSFYSKAHESVLFYNNTCVNYLNDTINHFYLSDNTGGDEANNCEIVNNLVYDTITSVQNVGIRINTGVTGTVSNYNDIYSTTYAANGTTLRTLSEWQSINSLDLNSFNTDPNLKSSTELWPISQSNAFANGLNLGNDYKTGLDISSVWPDNVVLKNQISDWTIGAYVVIRPAISTFNSGIWIFNGGSVILK